MAATKQRAAAKSTRAPRARSGSRPTRPSAKPTRTAAKAKAPPIVASTSTHPVKRRTRESLAIIEKLRALCADLPGTVEQLAWGEPTWRVKGKLYAQLDDHHHGSQHVAVWIPAEPGVQQALIDSDPARFFRPPYVGHKGWVAIVLDTDPDWGMVSALLAQAHALIGAKR